MMNMFRIIFAIVLIYILIIITAPNILVRVWVVVYLADGPHDRLWLRLASGSGLSFQATHGRPEPQIGSQSKVCNVNSIKIRRALRT